MGERNRFAFDRDYYNRIAAEYVHGSSVRKTVREPETDKELEEYLTEKYAPEYRSSNRAFETARSSVTGRIERGTSPAKPEKIREPEKKSPKRTQEVPSFKTRYLVRINFIKVLIIGVLLFAVVQSALNLISVKSDVNRIEKEISAAKITLEDVNSYNESLLGRLDISYDRNYIYNVAVGKLGMVYPKDNAVVYYKEADTSHVYQYRDIS